MTELATTLNENRFFGGYIGQQALTTSGGEYGFNQRLLQPISVSAPTTLAYGAPDIVPTNQTVACPFIAIQRITDYEKYRLEDTSRSDIPFAFLSEYSSFLRETTETHSYTGRNHSGLYYKTWGYLEVQFIYDLDTLPQPWMPTQVTQEREGQEAIRADTNQILSFKELVNVLDRISHPTEVEEIPLPFDPDDYPVV
jgi:hypothetical protein